jgi:hypothetical protein
MPRQKRGWKMLQMSDRCHVRLEIAVAILIVSVMSESTFAKGFTAKQGKLSPDYSAEVIQSNAREEKYLTVRMFEKPVSWTAFHQMVAKKVAEGSIAIGIGVVVDAQNERWPSDDLAVHIRNVKKEIVEILVGNKKQGVVGFAEKYGVMVQVVIPIIYQPDYSLTLTGDGENVKVPLALGSILLAVNDHIYAFKSKGVLIDSVDELRPHFESYIEKGKHLVSAAEYIEQKNADLEALQNRLKQIDRDIEKSEAVIARASADNIELILRGAMLFPEDLSSTTTKGRENRLEVETYFDQRGLPMNKQRYDIIAMYDTFLVHAHPVYRRGCELGDAESCKTLAFSYESGRIVTKDPDEAARLFRLACDYGSSVACNKLAEQSE